VLPGGAPSLFAPIVGQLGAAKLLRDGRVAVEKPFGHDLASARELDARLHRLLRESQIRRVDHFPGKEPVVELGYLRFANVALAGLRDRKSVSCAQITTAEDFGVEGRGRFYDSAGAPRDGVQNHLRRCWPWSPWTRRPAPAPATRRIRRRRCSAPCRRPFPGTACAASTRGTPTSPARRPGRPPRPSWRCGWRSATDAGPTSPVFLRAGKALPRKVTEVRLFLRRTPRLAFLPGPARAGPNQIVLRIDPDPGLRLQLSALAGQSWRPVHLDTSFARELGGPPEPYEVLLHAAMAGDHQYFARQDSVEETWRIVQPLLGRPPGVRPYPRGSWGPEEAETRVRGYPRWQQPWLPADR
jgi:glucose-6-phosphate 1-dehydrogenase